MNKNTQLEELANDYYEAMLKARGTICSMNEGAPKWYAKELYAKGWRKASEGKEFIELPCRVGQKAYHLTSADTLEELEVAEIFEGKVCSFSKDEKGLWIFCRYDNGLNFWYVERDVGRKLFFDRAEAEAKLREMEGERRKERE